MATIDEFAVAANGQSYIPGVPFADGNFFIQATALSSFGSLLPPWWSKSRDKALSVGWKDTTLLSILMFAAQTKIANMPIRVVAIDQNIESHRRMAEELTDQFHTLSEFGDGLQEMMVPVAEDYFGTDNGAFIEVVAEGKKSEPVLGIPLGMRHLDSLHVSRMSDPIFPVRYYPPHGSDEPIIYHHSRIISMSQMRSARREMNGVGFSAISRTIEIAQRYQDVINYVRGKMGGKAFKRLLVGTNITGREIIKAIAASTAIQQEVGDLSIDSVAIGGPDISMESIDLANFTEFSEQEATYNTMALMALAWGLEFNEAFPMPGSKASEEVALQRSRGRLPSFFVSRFSRVATAKLVPPYLRVEIDFVDDYLDQQREIIADIRARNLQRLVESGILTPEAARARLYQDHYISDTMRLTMSLGDGKLTDGTPALRVFLDSDYNDILTVNRAYLLGDADPEQVEMDVRRNLIEIYSLYPLTSSSTKHDKYRIASRALQDLLAMYQQPVAVSPQEEPEEEEPEEEQPEEQPEEEQGGEKAAFRKARGDAEAHKKKIREELLVILMRPGGPSDSELMDKMENAMRTAAILALGQEELTQEEEGVIDRELAFVSASTAAIIARALNGTDMGPTADRMSSHVMRVYWDIYANSGMTKEAEYSWVLGDTEHCSDCLEQAEKGARPGSHWAEMAANGIYPQSANLECHGDYCQCGFV